jgi:hypothetical protein
LKNPKPKRFVTRHFSRADKVNQINRALQAAKKLGFQRFITEHDFIRAN